MRGIVLLFKSKTLLDSEEFVYPNVNKVKLTIEGIPNEVHSQGIHITRCWGEANRFFSSKQELDEKMTAQTFYKDRYFLVIDLHSHQDNLTANRPRPESSKHAIRSTIGGDKEGHHGKRHV